MIQLLNKKDKDGILDFIREIEPLEFESYDTSEYIKFLLDFHKNRLMLGELDYLYEENKLGKQRLEEVNIIGADNVTLDRKSTRLNSSHVAISYAVFCLKKKNKTKIQTKTDEYTTRINYMTN